MKCFVCAICSTLIALINLSVENAEIWNILDKTEHMALFPVPYTPAMNIVDPFRAMFSPIVIISGLSMDIISSFVFSSLLSKSANI